MDVLIVILLLLLNYNVVQVFKQLGQIYKVLVAITVIKKGNK